MQSATLLPPLFVQGVGDASGLVVKSTVFEPLLIVAYLVPANVPALVALQKPAQIALLILAEVNGKVILNDVELLVPSIGCRIIIVTVLPTLQYLYTDPGIAAVSPTIVGDQLFHTTPNLSLVTAPVTIDCVSTVLAGKGAPPSRSPRVIFFVDPDAGSCNTNTSLLLGTVFAGYWLIFAIYFSYKLSKGC